MIKKIIVFLSLFFISTNFTYAKEKVEFSECVDGDTIKIILDGKKYSVRMIAIDTPESVHPQKGIEYYGKEASEYTCNQAKNAKKIEIEYDENCQKTDKYGRIMAWVFVDGKLLQKGLVENGYAKVGYLYDDYKYTSELEKVQELASAKEIGLWNESAKQEYENSTKTDSKDTTEESSNITKSTDENKSYSTKDIIIIVILLLIIVFVGDKTVKNKAKKKLKKYLG